MLFRSISSTSAPVSTGRISCKCAAPASERRISGKAVTPFLLEQLEKITGGQSLVANRALLINNAEVAALVSVSLSKIGGA